jgi:hypothetical protein
VDVSKCVDKETSTKVPYVTETVHMLICLVFDGGVLSNYDLLGCDTL